MAKIELKNFLNFQKKYEKLSVPTFRELALELISGAIIDQKTRFDEWLEKDPNATITTQEIAAICYSYCHDFYFDRETARLLLTHNIHELRSSLGTTSLAIVGQILISDPVRLLRAELIEQIHLEFKRNSEELGNTHLVRCLNFSGDY